MNVVDVVVWIRSRLSELPLPIATAGSGTYPTWSPDGRRFVFILVPVYPYDFEVWTIDSDGRNPERLTVGRKVKEEPGFTPDGRHVLFLSLPKKHGNPRMQFDLMQVDVDRKNLRRITGPDL